MLKSEMMSLLLNRMATDPGDSYARQIHLQSAFCVGLQQANEVVTLHHPQVCVAVAKASRQLAHG